MYLNTDKRGQEASSSDTQRRVDAEVTRMLREAYSRVTTLLVSTTRMREPPEMNCSSWRPLFLRTIAVHILSRLGLTQLPYERESFLGTGRTAPAGLPVSLCMAAVHLSLGFDWHSMTPVTSVTAPLSCCH